MKNTIIIAVISIVVGVGAGWFIFRPAGDSGTSAERKVLYYRDPMNPENTSPTPKKAPDGMDFVPVYAEGASGSGEKKIAYYQDPMHPWFTSDKPGKAPDCGMDLVPVYEGESDTKGIKIDPVTVQNIGVKIEEVTTRSMKKIIRTVGRVQADETKIYSINTKIMGWVEKLSVDYTGKPVRKGEPLLELYSPELVTTQEEYLQAIRYQKKLGPSSLGEARKGAENLVESAKRRLLYWDIPESEIQALERRDSPNKTMTFYSPVNGYVTDKMVFKGQSVMAGMELYKIVDLSTVWILADIYQFELPWLKVGQKADIELSYMPGKKFSGTVTFIYPTLNMETKTAKVRIEVRNTANLEFKPEMFATVEIKSPVALNAVAVPEQAIIHSGARNVAVIALGGGYFDPREVTLGVTAGGFVQILDGINEGEKIVVSSQFLIDSESNLKAVISQMSGHAGHDMSKPMDSTTSASEGKQSGQSKTSANMNGHEGHDMKTGKSGRDHDMKEMQQKEPKDAETKKATPDQSHEAPLMQETKTGGKLHKESHEEMQRQTQSMVDPVCGMEASGDEKLSYVYNGKKYYFCSKFDMEKFKNDPDKYAN